MDAELVVINDSMWHIHTMDRHSDHHEGYPLPSKAIYQDIKCTFSVAERAERQEENKLWETNGQTKVEFFSIAWFSISIRAWNETSREC